MFIEITSAKGKMYVNVNEVLFVAETKKNTSTLFLTDGTMLDLDMTGKEVQNRLNSTSKNTVCALSALEK